MRITALSVDNFKRIKHVEIRPGERALLIVGGRNRQGKSSLLDAITAAFGGRGAVPIAAVRKGERSAEIRVELDDGALTIRRRITDAGRHSLEVRDWDGKVKSPQAMLDKLVGTRFLDPLEFSLADTTTQRDMLLRVMDLDLDLDAWELEREKVYDARTEIGRDKRRLEAELEGIGEPAELPEETSVAETAARLASIQAIHQERLNEERRLTEMRAESERLQEELDQLRADLAAKDARLTTIVAEGVAQAGLVAQLEASDDPGAIETLKADLDGAEQHNRAIAEARARNRRHEEVKAEATAAVAGYDQRTTALEQLDAKKAGALAAASMPIKGLGVDAECVTFDGVPFSQASGAEQLRVSLSIAAALSPEVRDVWIKSGALCDEESLDMVRGFAEEHGCCVWLERIGDSDDDAIIIEDGMVRDDRQPDAA